MMTKQEIELIRSLAKKKARQELGLFVAEGEKIVHDLLGTELKIWAVYGTTEASGLISGYSPSIKYCRISAKEMERISAFSTPSPILAIFKIPSYQEVETNTIESLSLVLDGLQDPGNLGTIIRLADWFGIKHIFCSENCVDLYNPKCVRSTMGAIARVNTHYLDLVDLLHDAENHNIPVYGTFMDGEDVFQTQLSGRAFVVMGSEGSGISPELTPFLTKKISIPAYPADNKDLESLNVAVSAAIICAEFRRRLRVSGF